MQKLSLYHMMFHVLGTRLSAPPPTFWHFLGFYLSGSDLSLDIGDSVFFLYSHKLGLHLVLFGRNLFFQLGCVQNEET